MMMFSYILRLSPSLPHDVRQKIRSHSVQWFAPSKVVLGVEHGDEDVYGLKDFIVVDSCSGLFMLFKA